MTPGARAMTAPVASAATVLMIDTLATSPPASNLTCTPIASMLDIVRFAPAPEVPAGLELVW
jgi:hypothetical protein